MCVQQGYVPSTCTMEGQMCWLLVQEKGDPCEGCNENRSKCNGRHAPYEDKAYGLMCFLDRMDEVDKREREERRKRLQEIIDKRKEGHLNGYTRTILEISQEIDPRKGNWYIPIEVKDCVEEKVYYTRSDNIPEAISIVHMCCHKYKVEQIHVEVTGAGQTLYDALIDSIANIDIVPFQYRKIDLRNI